MKLISRNYLFPKMEEWINDEKKECIQFPVPKLINSL